MKKIYLLFCLSLCLSLLAGCFEDDSSMGTIDVPEIEITKMKDTTIVSYSGNVLKVTPEVETAYPESDLTYKWYYYPIQNYGGDAGWKGGYRNNLICEGKELSYEVNLPSGSYTFILEVASKTSDYTRTQTFKLRTTTEFTACFYVLKETTDGNSDLDLVSGSHISSDVVTKVHGAPVAGKPVNLSYFYNQGYIDEEAGGSAGARAMYVFTEEDCRVYNTETMAELFDRTTLNYSPLPEGEMPRSIFCSLVSMMLTDKGFYFNRTPYDASMDYTDASKFGLSVGAGGSRWVVAMGTDFAYWSEAEHHIYMTDMNATAITPLEYDDVMPAGVDEQELECIAAGHNYTGGMETNWFLLENKTDGNRYLYFLDNYQTVYEIRKLPASSHLAKATSVATCGMNAPLIYAIDGNSLWCYYFEDGSETPVTLPGIGGEETLAYVSNQFLNAASAMMGTDDSFDFNALVIATQKGEEYNLYIYDELVGGFPQKAVEPVTGTGRVQSVRFAAPISFSLFDYIMPMSGPYFPLCD